VSVHGFHVGTADLQSAGPITFGPGGSLFLADTRAAKIKALDVADLGGGGASSPFHLEDIDTRIGALLRCTINHVTIRDMATYPIHRMCISR